MRPLVALAALVLAGAVAASEPELRTDRDRTLYAIGAVAADSFRRFELTPEEFEVVARGLQDALEGKAVIPDAAAYRPRINALAQERGSSTERRLFDQYASEKGATRTSSGLVLVPVAAGTGPEPGKEDVVKVQYVGRLASGAVFDDTGKRGSPAIVPLGRAIACWKEALPMMRVGGKARVACPPVLAYGDRGMPGLIPPNAALFFEIELVSIPAHVVTSDAPIPGTVPAGVGGSAEAGTTAPPVPAPAPSSAPARSAP